jgi:signal transduction histidine kinase
VASGSSSVTLARLLQTGTFRLSVIFSGACVASGLMLFAVIYWQTKTFETRRIAAIVAAEAAAISQGSPDEIMWMVQTQFPQDHHDGYDNITFSAIFTQDHHLIAGNLGRVPPGLPEDGQAHLVELRQPGAHPSRRPMIAVARVLPDGRLLVLSRGLGVLMTLEDIVAGALLLGAIPAIGPALLAGIWLSRQAQRRVKAVNQSIGRIMRGAVHERLPLQGVGDDFDQLANSVNRMLAEIQRLLEEVQGASDNIAHDLRTPLARVRTLLERGRDRADTKADLAAIADRAIAGLDQAQSIITALLRIGEIEGGQRRAAFCNVDLNEIAAAAGDLYAPIAEEKQLQFVVQTDARSPVYGDRDLLIEAVANLVDNAIKFAPPGGDVRLVVEEEAAKGPLIRVVDNGPGIPSAERTAVMTRFYRVDKSRHVKGSGLGLSIVLAIVNLHDFDIAVDDANPGCNQPGCVFELRCHAPRRPQVAAVPAPTVWRLKLRMRRRCGRGGETGAVATVEQCGPVGAVVADLD